jgi:hypothetical protein
VTDSDNSRPCNFASHHSHAADYQRTIGNLDAAERLEDLRIQHVMHECAECRSAMIQELEVRECGARGMVPSIERSGDIMLAARTAQAALDLQKSRLLLENLH